MVAQSTTERDSIWKFSKEANFCSQLITGTVLLKSSKISIDFSLIFNEKKLRFLMNRNSNLF